MTLSNLAPIICAAFPLWPSVSQATVRRRTGQWEAQLTVILLRMSWLRSRPAGDRGRTKDETRRLKGQDGAWSGGKWSSSATRKGMDHDDRSVWGTSLFARDLWRSAAAASTVPGPVHPRQDFSLLFRHAHLQFPCAVGQLVDETGRWLSVVRRGRNLLTQRPVRSTRYWKREYCRSTTYGTESMATRGNCQEWG